MLEEPAGAEQVSIALALLWRLDEELDDIRRLEGHDATVEHWLRYTRDCKRWVATVGAAGRTRELPPDLLRKRAILNLHNWRIPNV